MAERISLRLLRPETAEGVKQSKVSGLLLHNYILSINLMKSVATKFSDLGFQEAHEAQLRGLRDLEL